MRQAKAGIVSGIVLALSGGCQHRPAHIAPLYPRRMFSLDTRGNMLNEQYCVRSIAFDKDGRAITVRDNGEITRRKGRPVWIPGSVSRWDLESGQLVSRAFLFSYHCAEAPTAPKQQVRAELDLRRAKVRLVNTGTRRTVRSLDPFCEKLRGFSPDGRFLVGANNDAWSGGYFTVVWETGTGARVLETGYCGANAFSRDGRFLALGLGYGDGTITVWDTTAWSKLHTLSPHPENAAHTRGDRVDGLATSPDGKYLLAWTSGPPWEGYWLWNVPEERLLTRQPGVVSAGKFSPDGRMAAIAVGHQVELWQISQ